MLLYGGELVEVGAEGEDGEAHEFEVLEAEGDAYDGHAEQEPPKEVGDGNRDAPDKPPDYVHYTGEAARRPAAVVNIGPERPKGQYGEFQRLQPERDADNRNHHQHARNGILYRDHQTAEHYPDYIQQYIHRSYKQYLPQI